jgi:Holliday junction DNA helicase RuvB
MPLYHIKGVISKLNNILDSAVSIVEPNFEYGREVVGEETCTAPYPDTNTLTTNGKEDIFQEIYGHENIKTVMNMTLKSEKPVHVLLTSPPGMAKTQFLLAIKNMFINESSFVIGSNCTKKGIIDLLFEKRPQILLIDELETMSYDAQESLLNLMETGIISETKKTCRREMQLEDIKVFATSNDTKALCNPLLSRFIVVNIPQYTDEEFKEIVFQRLTNKEGVSEEVAKGIANQVIQRLNRRDLRDCIKVARIAKSSKEIMSVIDVMK